MGRPKAWLPFGDERMLPRVVRILSTVVNPVVVVAAPGQDVPPLPDSVAIVRDPIEGQGPLQGLLAGLDALAGRADAAYLSSCDVPLLRPAFVRRVIERLGTSAICVPFTDGYHHPLAAVYRLDVADVVRSLLAADRRRPVFLFESVPTQVLTGEDLADVDATRESLRNLNTPADYEAALVDSGASGGREPPDSYERESGG
jgi:molybdopterin-guanine dinucleotide biosynthesis protein A